MRIQAAAATRSGLREKNEDSFGLFVPDGVVCLADGMGGLAEGARASRTAVTTVEGWSIRLREAAARIGTDALPERPRTKALREEMERVFQAAADTLHQSVLDEGVGMGTTLTAIAFAGDAMVVGHIGDCRLYRVRRGQLHVITRDHSLAAAHLQLGLLSLDAYRRSPLRNVLYQCLGPQPVVRPDVLEIGIEDGDVLALVTDGVWSVLSDELLGRLAANVDPAAAAESLVDSAIAAGSDDNCTAVVVRARASAAIDGQSLAVSQLFRQLGNADLDLLSPFVATRCLAEGETILREGDRGHEMFIIERGAVEVTRCGEPLAQLGPGSCFGEIPLPRSGPRTTAVQAVIPTRLVVLDCACMSELEGRRPELAQKLLARFEGVVASHRVDAHS
jgi:PPM family protein phosphatase